MFELKIKILSTQFSGSGQVTAIRVLRIV